MSSSTPTETKVAFVSLGCAKNLVDSEKMLGQLAEAGCAITGDDSADVVVINTCGFLDASRMEADDVIADAIERKGTGGPGRVVVAGCLVQRDREGILERLPGIDALVGVNNRDDIVNAVLGRPARAREREADVYLSEYHPFTQTDLARLRLTPQHYAYLRISEGCDQKCTFCTIPSIRGRMHCKPPEAVLAEARELAGDGAVELHLIGQDTTSYGLGENPFDTDLAALLRMLNDVDGVDWIRLMYVYPSVMTDEIIDAVADLPGVCKYIDIPLQHISDGMLKAMYRRINRSDTEKLLEKLRTRIPGVTIRTTMITGFPGETEAQFEELCTFIREFKFDALGAFTFSPEPGTPAARMTEQLPDQVGQDRYDALMSIQQKVAFELADARIDGPARVLIDDIEEGVRIGRHEGQAPFVDSVTMVENCDAQPGEFVDVKITDRHEYDLVARPLRRKLNVLHGS